jgi:NAD(P)-dependent dehydrogenase (short-subunit alcohol dehydrogenase family)
MTAAVERSRNAGTPTKSPVVIVGGTGGVGSALARACLADGHAVHLIASNERRLAEAATQSGVTTAAADVGDAAALSAAVHAGIVDGKLAGLAYAVGSIDLKPLKRVVAEDFERSYRLNVVGAAMAAKAAAEALAAARGAIVLFSSVAAAHGFPQHSIIAAAKGAVEALTRSLAAELAPAVRVNCVALSLTRTPLAQPLLANEAMARAIAAAHPLQRLGEAEDAAGLAAFLLSDRAAWITGQVFAVDGGRSTVRTKS